MYLISSSSANVTVFFLGESFFSSYFFSYYYFINSIFSYSSFYWDIIVIFPLGPTIAKPYYLNGNGAFVYFLDGLDIGCLLSNLSFFAASIASFYFILFSISASNSFLRRISWFILYNFDSLRRIASYCYLIEDSAQSKSSYGIKNTSLFSKFGEW